MLHILGKLKAVDQLHQKNKPHASNGRRKDVLQLVQVIILKEETEIKSVGWKYICTSLQHQKYN